ncbi:hypothetical protein MRBLWH7_003748 [Microbacterium sp. LWH7-1.2]|jgi:alpha-N-arabinofuranosidase|uniref:alpha-L-arabinofuranosidase C-terminal domain-containing protein n=1 Tax=Microbacterium sp. LWH7-1.2 TaxID=3135257 RepID=UPI003138B47D
MKSVLRSDKTIDISLDEWNIWYAECWEKHERITDIETWPIARRLLEDVYSVTDAVVFGCLLISLLKHADRANRAGRRGMAAHHFRPRRAHGTRAQRTVLRLEIEAGTGSPRRCTAMSP